MPPDESSYPGDWVRIAEKDLARVERSLANEDAELAGFCLQQAVEKFLKAFLLSKGWQLRRTHDLVSLLDDAITYEPSHEAFREGCERITTFYTIDRYPLRVPSGLTIDEVRASLQAVLPFIEALRQAID